MGGTVPSSDERKPLAVPYDPRYVEEAVVTGQPQAVESAPIIAPPGAPTHGRWVEDRYCGITTWVIAIVGGFPCSFFCPCDRRTVWLVDQVKYNEKGAVVDDYLFRNPCPPDSIFHPNPDRR